MSTLNDILDPFIDQLSPSRAVFAVELDNGDEDLELKVKQKSDPGSESDDLVSILVVENFHESFDKETGRFVVQRDSIRDRVIQDIKASLSLFLEKNLESKKPQQTQLYKWLRWSNFNESQHAEGLVLLYKYLYEKAGENGMRFAKDDIHAKNGILLLEKIRENDEKSKP